MRQRCRRGNENAFKAYKHVSVCDDWEKSFAVFQQWALDNGYQDTLTLDRIDPYGDYEPENCRWITLRQQMRNKRNNKLLKAWGEEKTAVEWIEDERCKVAEATVYWRVANGWPPEDAISKPPESPIGKTKLTLQEKQSIRDMKGIASQKALAAKFGVSRSLVQGIQSGRM